MSTAAPLSGANPRIKRLRRLAGRRSSRSDEGAFVIEGPVLVREALDAGLDVEEVFVDEASAGAWPDDSATLVQAGVLASVLSSATPQPVCATAATTLGRPVAELFAAAAERSRPVLVLVDLADPGNAGTLLRAAEAAGCAGVVFAGTAVDAYNPKTVRAAAGALFRVPWSTEPDIHAVLAASRAAGVPSLASVARDGEAHDYAGLDGAFALLVGNEAHGLDAAVVAAADASVTIAMDGPTESLNAAMAGTVLVFEALRQRRAR